MQQTRFDSDAKTKHEAADSQNQSGNNSKQSKWSKSFANRRHVIFKPFIQDVCYKYEHRDRVYCTPESHELEENEVNHDDPLENGDWANKTVIKMPFEQWNDSLLTEHAPNVKFYLT